MATEQAVKDIGDIVRQIDDFVQANLRDRYSINVVAAAVIEYGATMVAARIVIEQLYPNEGMAYIERVARAFTLTTKRLVLQGCEIAVARAQAAASTIQ